jgi:transcriptional regulator with XRE-family HTH domain
MEIKNTQTHTIGAKIKLARESLGISQSELSRMLDLSRGVCGRWERGLANPPIPQIKKIAQILQVSTDYLISECETDKHDAENIMNNSINSDILSWVNKLSIQQKQGLVNFLNLLEA